MQNNSVQGGTDMSENANLKRNVLLGVAVGIVVLVTGAIWLSHDMKASGTNQQGIAVGEPNGEQQDEVKEPVKGFEEPMCGFVLPQKPDWNIDYNKGGGVSVISAGREVVIACAAEIPGIPVAESQIENFMVDGVAGKLYHDASAKDGTKQDDIRVRHKNNQVDVSMRGTPGFVAEVGAAFTWSK